MLEALVLIGQTEHDLSKIPPRMCERNRLVNIVPAAVATLQTSGMIEKQTPIETACVWIFSSSRPQYQNSPNNTAYQGANGKSP
jgi:hypothetical protein